MKEKFFKQLAEDGCVSADELIK